MIESEMLKRGMGEDDLALLDREMDRLRKEVNIGYLLLIVLGIFGVHKFYIGKVGMGILYFFTGGLFIIGLLYDLVTFSRQVYEYNERLERDIIHRIELAKKARASA